MIVRDKPGLIELLFAMRGSVLPRIAAVLVFTVLWSVAVVWVDRHVLAIGQLGNTPFTLFGVALSLFLGFRNNAAYDRWWEARKLWGGLIADTRSLAREAVLFLPDNPAAKDVMRLMRAFLHLHRRKLRGLAQDEASATAATACNLGPEAGPDEVLTRMNALIAAEYAAGRLDGFGARTLSGRISGIALAQAGCERILATPLPYVYSLLVFRTSWLYVLLLPLALCEQTGWLTPAFTVIVAYTFFGLAEVTEELAHPFALSGNGLPLDAMCRVAEISLAPHLGETAPPPLAPVNYRLD